MKSTASSLLLAALAVLCLDAFATKASAQLSVSDARIRDGLLIVTGNTGAPDRQVRLDNRFNTRSGPNSAFKFSLSDYHPADCTVEVASGGNTVRKAVALCAPQGLVPRGAWSPSGSYLRDQLVTFDGSAWRAKEPNTLKRPDTSPRFWERLAPGGAIGQPGTQGPKGVAGPKGLAGAQGAQGIVGTKGVAGPTGLEGPRGTLLIRSITGNGRTIVGPTGGVLESSYVMLAGTFPFNNGPSPSFDAVISASVPIHLPADVTTPVEVRVAICLTNPDGWPLPIDQVVQSVLAGEETTIVTAGITDHLSFNSAGGGLVGLCLRLPSSGTVITGVAQGFVVLEAVP